MKTVAVIGCGKVNEGKEGWAIGHHHADGYLRCGQEVRLLGVDLSPVNLAAFGDKYALPKKQLFNSTKALYAAYTPDCVSICTWPELHYTMVVEALDHGVKGIACEKPFATDIGQIRDLEKRISAAGAQLVVCHQRRREANFIALKEVAQNGELGEQIQLMGHVGDGWDILSWTTHWFDMANFFFEKPPEWVLAGMHIRDGRRYHHAVEDASVIYANYGEGCEAFFLTGPGNGASFKVYGSRGMASIGADCIEVATFDGSKRVPVKNSEGGFAAVLKELLNALDGGPEPTCSIAQSAVATEIAYAAHESARTGKKVEIPCQVQFPPLEVTQNPVRSALYGKRLLLFADAHFGSGGREGIAEAFAEMTKNPVKVIDAGSNGLEETDMNEIDAILIYHTCKEVDQQTHLILTEWVSAGKPLLILHAGLGAWPEWTEYTQWCGKIWDWSTSIHPHESTTLSVTSGDPLNFGWSEAWLPRDEVFVNLKDISKVEVGLVSEINIGAFPAAWRNVEFLNVGVWMPGHRYDSWKIPAMRDGAGRVLIQLMKTSAPSN